MYNSVLVGADGGVRPMSNTKQPGCQCTADGDRQGSDHATTILIDHHRLSPNETKTSTDRVVDVHTLSCRLLSFPGSVVPFVNWIYYLCRCDANPSDSTLLFYLSFFYRRASYLRCLPLIQPQIPPSSCRTQKANLPLMQSSRRLAQHQSSVNTPLTPSNTH